MGIVKYLNTPFAKGCHLFGLFEAKAHILQDNFAVVVEGQFDVIKAWEKGICNVVATGSSSLTAYQLSLLARYTDRIVLLFDNDDAGDQGRHVAQVKLGGILNNLKLMTNRYLPDGYKDLFDFLEGGNSKKDLDRILLN
jgi:DNA primase